MQLIVQIRTPMLQVTVTSHTITCFGDFGAIKFCSTNIPRKLKFK